MILRKESRPACRHCGQPAPPGQRGLCNACYHSSVRSLYPPLSNRGRRGPGNFNGAAPLPSLPTAAMPGTAEKVTVLEERVQQSLAFWHPGDAARGL